VSSEVTVHSGAGEEADVLTDLMPVPEWGGLSHKHSGLGGSFGDERGRTSPDQDIIVNGATRKESATSLRSRTSVASTDRSQSTTERIASASSNAIGKVASAAAKEALFAASGAFRGIVEATRALELVTVGAYYKASSTAFVTLKTRVAKSSSHQMLLSHEHYTMEVLPSPNPKDIIWENVSTPYQQIMMRQTIANTALAFGAIFWSLVVGFITALANMDSLAEQWTWLQEYQDTFLYSLLNNYLALGILLILLALLPFIFDTVARSYEGLKLESEIQNSIMTRYFYYQLANVYVAVGLGSIANSIHDIIESPKSILSILGTSLPSFSIYFTGLLVVKCFTSVPIEMMRLWPLIRFLFLSCCTNKKKTTRRELRAGVFADIPLVYGWIYPNILMVMMILCTYACIAPFATPFAWLYYCFAYVMYRYQLLYVYVNPYQSGGFMWYSVFDRSMISLLGGVLVLLSYFMIRQTNHKDFSGLYFYALLPLPVVILIFWHKCHKKFTKPSSSLSLEKAIEIDVLTSERVAAGKVVPQQTFKRKLFRQPVLAEGQLKPAAYRNVNAMKTSSGTIVFSQSISPQVSIQNVGDEVTTKSVRSEKSGTFDEESGRKGRSSGGAGGTSREPGVVGKFMEKDLDGMMMLVPCDCEGKWSYAWSYACVFEKI
jgi:hypothetical protein